MPSSMKTWWRPVAALALTLGFVAAPVTGSAAPAPDEPACSYGDVPKAPAGHISRDDAIQPRHDPLAAWRKTHTTRANKASKVTQAATVTVPVAFHVLRKDTSVSGGNIPQAWIDDQIDVLNAAYASSGFRFELESTSRTTASQWFKMAPTSGNSDVRFVRGGGKEINMKQALHEGGADTLNLYSGDLGKVLLGWAYLPWEFDAANGGLPRFYDGVVLDYRSLPGGPLAPYNEGDTGTHEVGHWLGLLHTFNGGCTAPGDFVDDTAYEASPAFGCPTGRDTCLSQPGADPIHNFMDYTEDACMFEFTPGQAVRMQESWTAYRT